MLHIHFSSIEPSTSPRLTSQKLPLPLMGAHPTVRILSRWLPADVGSALPKRSIRLRRDILAVAFEVVLRAPGIPQYTTLAAERQRIKRLVIAKALAMQSGVSHV